MPGASSLSSLNPVLSPPPPAQDEVLRSPLHSLGGEPLCGKSPFSPPKVLWAWRGPLVSPHPPPLLMHMTGGTFSSQLIKPPARECKSFPLQMRPKTSSTQQ